MTRTHAMRGARIVFVLLTVALAWWGFRGRWDEIGGVVADTGPARLVVAMGCAVGGLVLTGVVWRMLLTALGPRVEPREAAAVFFVGQLGKYVPGSVWSFAAQAQLGRRCGVPPRSSVAASALFLVIHAVSGLVLGGVLVAAGAIRTDPGVAWWLLLSAAGAIALSPPLLRAVGDRVAAAGVRTRFDGTDLVRSLALMTGVWACYGTCLWVLIPSARTDPQDLVAAVAAFALAHTAGVLMVLAPAGVGAREAVLIVLLAPAVGVPAAAAAALLARLTHSVADFVLAAGAAVLVRGSRSPEVVGVHDQ
ncbi:lysylphosphatidylglycerol synthase domain-containing protein [Nocardioides sp.]|uniref:lysylphosphatidylglycerol synthase domain-containing protein n=1 Tax=Nocardioides sp. TaxID=35761 RepID=UPI002C6CC464|nr:lysylphosphatidylglycerol synthase domain-containing protein [Nocardioides sp.]HXH77521.1 lysylphosphatidylglycerol synthase domain-containing protein [Nocardioides sp.]